MSMVGRRVGLFKVNAGWTGGGESSTAANVGAQESALSHRARTNLRAKVLDFVQCGRPDRRKSTNDASSRIRTPVGMGIVYVRVASSRTSHSPRQSVALESPTNLIRFGGLYRP